MAKETSKMDKPIVLTATSTVSLQNAFVTPDGNYWPKGEHVFPAGTELPDRAVVLQVHAEESED